MPTGDFTSAILERVRVSRTAPPRRFPGPWPVMRRPAVIIALTLLPLACAAAAAYFVLYPIPEGFDLSVNYGHSGADVIIATTEDMDRLVSGPSNDSGATWSPDCSRIAFTSNRPNSRSANYNIWVMNADGTDPVQLTVGHPSGAAHWSPDGARIGFTRLVLVHDRGPRLSDGWIPPSPAKST